MRAIGLGDYLELLDWTARQTVPGKCGVTPAAAPAILARLTMSPRTWCELVRNPQQIDATRSI